MKAQRCSGQSQKEMLLGTNWLIILDITWSTCRQLLSALKADHVPACLAQSMTLCWHSLLPILCGCHPDQTKQARGCANRNVCFHIIASMSTSLLATAENLMLLLLTYKHVTKCCKAMMHSLTSEYRTAYSNNCHRQCTSNTVRQCLQRVLQA